MSMGREGISGSIVKDIQRAYYGVVYDVTKAALEPVVAAVHDVVRDSVCRAIRDGIKDAVTPTDRITDLVSGFIFGRKKK